MDALVHLVARAGDVVPKSVLAEAVASDSTATGDETPRIVAGLRRALGRQADGAPYIQTVIGKGYRFVAPVEPDVPKASSVGVDALIEPHQSFVSGRAALESLEPGAVGRAREAFEEALRVEPHFLAAHIGMANACVLAFDSVRARTGTDAETLRQAVHHAYEACRLEPTSAEAWSTRATVSARIGDGQGAISAARHAVKLDPDDWRHQVRLAAVAWGEERLRAAHRVLALCPEVAVAYWFMATVFVARDALDWAVESLRAGCQLHDARRDEGSRFTAPGLHLLNGLVLAARGDRDQAYAELNREVALESAGNVYARESAGSAWYAIGALRLWQGQCDEAFEAFRQATTRVPGHMLAAIGSAASTPLRHPLPTRGVASTVDTAIVYAAVLALEGKHHDAAQLCDGALSHADPGPAGWLLPVEPLLQVASHREAWRTTLATLRERAS